MVTVVSYKEEYKEDFKKFNMDWLNKYFIPESYDIEVLSNPEKYIIDKEGGIYFVLENNIPKGTVALMHNHYGELELTKMGIDETVQGKGYGNLLMQHCIKEAKEKGAKELILYSNTKLEPAIHLYRKYGFTEIPIEKSEYERCNIKMKLIIK